jgi:hypothetical protein
MMQVVVVVQALNGHYRRREIWIYYFVGRDTYILFKMSISDFFAQELLASAGICLFTLLLRNTLGGLKAFASSLIICGLPLASNRLAFDLDSRR